MEMDDFEPLDPAPVAQGLHSLVEALRPHIETLVPDGASAIAETALVFDDGFRVEMTVSVRVVFETKGNA